MVVKNLLVDSAGSPNQALPEVVAHFAVDLSWCLR